MPSKMSNCFLLTCTTFQLNDHWGCTVSIVRRVFWGTPDHDLAFFLIDAADT